ncbi:MAG: type II toxin-antitoxin system RelE/ParE family toxin [Candidatus Levybacteria bacterium]|nr:type II toxin-antitoxin system RelE/ParE family toxin [Candidatus Levybacteria bacterium]
MEVIIDDRVKRVVKSFSDADQARIRGYTNLFREQKFILSGKYLKKLKNNLWELRPGKIRVLFGILNQTMVIVHVYKKQTQKIPLQEIKTAGNRIKEYGV